MKKKGYGKFSIVEEQKIHFIFSYLVSGDAANL